MRVRLQTLVEEAYAPFLISKCMLYLQGKENSSGHRLPTESQRKLRGGWRGTHYSESGVGNGDLVLFLSKDRARIEFLQK